MRAWWARRRAACTRSAVHSRRCVCSALPWLARPRWLAHPTFAACANWPCARVPTAHHLSGLGLRVAESASAFSIILMVKTACSPHQICVSSYKYSSYVNCGVLWRRVARCCHLHLLRPPGTTQHRHKPSRLTRLIPIRIKNDNCVASPCRAAALSAASRLVLLSNANWNQTSVSSTNDPSPVIICASRRGPSPARTASRRNLIFRAVTCMNILQVT